MNISPAVIWAVVAMIVATIVATTIIIETSKNPAPLLGLVPLVVIPAIAQLVSLGRVNTKVDKVNTKVDAVHQEIQGEDSEI